MTWLMDEADVCRTSSRASRRPLDVISTVAILDPRWRGRKWRHPGPGAVFSSPVVAVAQDGGPSASGRHLGWPHLREPEMRSSKMATGGGRAAILRHRHNGARKNRPILLTSSTVFKSRFNEVKQKYLDFCHIYTDGSKVETKVASAYVCPYGTRGYRLRDGCSIFTAEVEAINKALTFIKVSTRKSFVIFSDSMSVLQAIESQESKNPLVNRVLQACQQILFNDKFITFCWLPSHRDIRGNEDADRAAKDALSKVQPEKFDLPCTDVFMKIQPFISSLWQERWDKEVDNKLHAIMPQIDDKYYSGCTNRKDEVIINRLRIGHTRLTHSFRMENRPHPPLCDQCEGDHELTVKHILIECDFLKIIRRRHYDVTDLNQLFKTVSSKRILDFVKDIGLYNSL